MLSNTRYTPTHGASAKPSSSMHPAVFITHVSAGRLHCTPLLFARHPHSVPAVAVVRPHITATNCVFLASPMRTDQLSCWSTGMLPAEVTLLLSDPLAIPGSHL